MFSDLHIEHSFSIIFLLFRYADNKNLSNFVFSYLHSAIPVYSKSKCLFKDTNNMYTQVFNDCMYRGRQGQKPSLKTKQEAHGPHRSPELTAVNMYM